MGETARSIDQPLDLDTEVVDDPDAGPSAAEPCAGCGARATASRPVVGRSQQPWCGSEECSDRIWLGAPLAEFRDLVEVIETVQIGAAGKPDESTRSIEILGPATSADLLDLDAVPDPIDSDAPGVPYATPLPISDLAELWEREIAAANKAADRKERCFDAHGYGCARPECGRAPVRERDIRGLASYVPQRGR